MYWRGRFLLEQIDEESSQPLHHADLQLGAGNQLIQQLDEQHMVLLAELPSIQAHIPTAQRPEVRYTCLPL